MLTQHLMPKSAKIQNNSKNDFPSRTYVPPASAIFLSKILILVSPISYLTMIIKARWFSDGKEFNFSK